MSRKQSTPLPYHAEAVEQLLTEFNRDAFALAVELWRSRATVAYVERHLDNERRARQRGDEYLFSAENQLNECRRALRAAGIDDPTRTYEVSTFGT